MTGDDDKKPPQEERTVFMPAPGQQPPAADPWGGAPPPPAPVDWGSPPPSQPADWGTPPAPPPSSQQTQGGWGAPPSDRRTAPGVPVQPAPPPSQDQTAFNRTYMPMAPRLDGDRIQIGDVLNHIFRVDRFIARGGMGEVFEGSNVNSDERVAIKVMLPALAADPNVQAMFRKEAKTLTRLTHPALVQYRVLAQEPQLGVLYIVTEYIDGKNLADVLGTLRPNEDELAMLTRRLADGLRVAHSLGAIHRDISPDNVLLEDGRLDKAKVIDFGIAKDLDPGSKTIVGDGFAGKLNYVAPEQLGDFGRDVGPWSDVYSLGLVILAVAMGRNVEMGATLVDAVDKRRAGPDLTPIPEKLRPVLAKMLAANPAERLRSMEEVIAALDGGARGAAPAAARVAEPAAAPAKSKTPLIAGGAIAALLVLGVGGWALTSGGDKPADPTVAAAGGAGAGAVADSGLPVADQARGAIDAALPGIGCTWLDITDITQRGERGVAVALNGVADAPGRAQGAISKALQEKGITAADINFEEVATVPASMCDALDAFRAIRAPNAEGLTVAQRKWERAKGADGATGADVVLNIDLGPANQGVGFFGLTETGAVENVNSPDGPVTKRATMEGLLKGVLPNVTPLGGNKYRVPLFIDHLGWSGFMLLTGKEPFDGALITTPPGQRGADWKQKFEGEAQRGGWKSEMVWFKTVDEIPG
ncbi:serine/threonine-protein kinase [Sphingomonas jatrophae]|uniref:Serine/threonine protein kinase n=1 Tax=Sphingomonas jatrophae TaxID=1166337 RepID=A0A1I6LK48_9SPHN|nr:serine/threonine-protein kinase [Sphingomonas jatrophae]SFS03844.1 serine/threonine protein kinase [Sphingomonas jatrophae]